jgi:hypothetical protein
MARARTSLALILGAVAALGPSAVAGGDSKPIDVDMPLPGDNGTPPAAGSDQGKGSTGGTEVEMGEDDSAPSDDPTGTKENPNAPVVAGDTAVRKTPNASAAKPAGYPIEEVLRPITLPQATSEVRIDLRSTFSPGDGGAVLRARYGITRQAQVGLDYVIGGVFKEISASPDAKTKFNTGKAIGVEGAYLVTDWMAVHLRVPMYMQPFAIGVVLGAPMKFRFGDKLALFALDDVIDINIHNFVPSLQDERANRAAADLLMSNPVRQNGNVRLTGGAIYQIHPNLAVIGRTGVEFPDFKSQGLHYPLEGILQLSRSNKLDLAARIGFDNLQDASGTFGIQLSAAYRI